MTSNRSYSNKKMTYAGTVIRRKVWVTALTILVMFLFFVVGLGLAVNHATSIETPAAIGKSLTEIAVGFLGKSSPFLGMTAVLAAINGLIGFSWLHRRTSADFYLSEPYTRETQMAAEMLGSVIQTAVFLAVFELIGYLMVKGFGATGQELAREVLQGYAAEMAFFLAVYMLAVFSCIICGNTLMSALVFIYFLMAEAVYRLVIRFYMSAYLKTFYDHDSIKCLFSPVYNLVEESFRTGIAKNLVFAAVFCLFSFLAFRLRPAEKAGRAFIFAPLYQAIKLSIAFLAALIAGWMLDETFSTINQPLSTPAVVTMVVTGTVACLILEVIYSGSLSGAGKRLWHIAAVCLGAIAVMYAFKTDLLGYDSYLPDAGDVKDCALICPDDYRSYYKVRDGEIIYTNMSDSPRSDDMHLTDVEAVIELAKIGQERAVALRDDETLTLTTNPDADVSIGTYAVVYHMKNGKDVYRRIVIPASIDASLMDRILTADEYWEKFYFIDILTEDSSSGEKFPGLEFTYYTAKGDKSIASANSDECLREFLKAYRKDLKTSGSYSVLMGSHPAGNFYIAGEYDSERHYYLEYSFPVFPEYENTIAFLKEKGAYIDELPDASSVKYIEIYPNSMVGPEHIYSTGPDGDGGSSLKLYDWGYTVTDSDTIAQILDVCEAYAEDWNWNSGDGCYEFSSIYRYRQIYVEAVSDDRCAILLVPAGAQFPEIP